MSGERDNFSYHRYPVSPGKITTLTVGRKLSRAGQDQLDEEFGEEEYYEVMERRGSNQSISRYSSCPHLAEKDPISTKESYEVTVDDIIAKSGAANKDYKCVVVQSPSPILRRRLNLDNFNYSDTPTPPSTPKSRRSFLSSRDSILSSPEKPFVSSPLGTPRLLRRKQVISSSLSRDSSLETEEKHLNPVAPLSMDNVLKFQEVRVMTESPPTSPGSGLHRPEVKVACETVSGTAKGGHSHGSHEVTDMVDKCETWLQTLQIGQGDRIKSRSHIQLPPI